MRARRLVAVLGTFSVLAACTGGSTPPTMAVTTLVRESAEPPTTTANTPTTPGIEALAGATGADQIPQCDPDLRPQPAIEDPVTPPVPGPVDLRVAGQIGGRVQSAELADDEVFVGSGRQVVHVELTDGQDPRELSVSSPLAGTVEDVTLVRELLLVAVGDGGLAVLDRQAELAVTSSLALPGYAHAVEMDGTHAFVADGPGGMRVVDLLDPAAPVEIAAVLDLHRIVDVAIDGDRAYLAAADEGLVVVDIAVPSAPREIGRLFTGGYAFAVASHGDRVLLADGWAGLQVIDVADPDAPRLLATHVTRGWAMDVETDGGRAYVASGKDFVMLEIADTDRLLEVGSLPFHSGHAIQVDVKAGRATIIDTVTGVRIVDVTGANPIELSIYAPLASASGLALARERVFVAAMAQGLRIIDVSDPESPNELPGIETQDPVHGVAAAGSNVFFTTWTLPGSRWVYSIFGLDASASDPVPERPFAAPLMLATASVGTAIFVAAEGNLVVLEASHPFPCLLSILTTQEFPAEGFEVNGITVDGDLAYVAPYYEEVRVVDVSDPRAPVLLPQTGVSGGVVVGKTLAVGEQLYAIGDDGQGPVVAVYDLAIPTSPALVGTVQLPAETARADEAGPPMAYGDGRLFVADGNAGLVVIDVSDPTRPVIAGHLRLPGDAVGVVVDDGRAYVASDGGGLFVVEWSEPQEGSSIGDLVEVGARGPTARLTQRAVLPSRWPAASSTGQAADADCLVTSTDDAGPGSLRECLAQTGGGGVISFDPAVFPNDAPATIHVEDGRLSVASGVSVDGSGAGVVIDGGEQVDTGLYVDSQAAISGLTVTGFTETGIYADGSGNTIANNIVSANGETGIALFGPDNRVVGNLVGLDPSGNRLWGAQSIGVFVSEAGNVIGGPNSADRNVISGHEIEIYLKGGTENTIQGNYIGIDRLGQMALSSPEARGIYIDSGASNNRVSGNVVAGGISVIDPGTSYNAIVGNLVGVDASGTRPLELAGGITIDEAFNRVGGTLPGEANIINGGIAIQASNVVVVGNRLGVRTDGNRVGTGGVQVSERGAVVGGRSPTAANVVSGDFSGAIRIRGDANLIIGNQIRIPGVPIPDDRESDNGILVEHAGRNHIIANLVETDAGAGIRLGAEANANVVRGNVLSRNAVGLIADPGSVDNVVSVNSFDANTEQALDLGANNRWDDGRQGNYWSEFQSTDGNGDGVLDESRQVRPRGLDRHPLARSPP